MGDIHFDETMLRTFSDSLNNFYAEHGRHDLPWRQPESDSAFDPYKILVSELMLQQTQVNRVIPKYNEFLRRFPDIHSLADASLGDVIRTWSGLGYNRRAKYLHDGASILDSRRDFPRDIPGLALLPGVGLNTAGAILAYAFNIPAVFVETNIRSVFIHHFFAGLPKVEDGSILKLVDRTMDRRNPRQWYWSLMDYGAMLKRETAGINRSSASYAKQPAFHGSTRQLRGQVLRMLAEKPYSPIALEQTIADSRLAGVLTKLQKEGLIVLRGSTLSLG